MGIWDRKDEYRNVEVICYQVTTSPPGVYKLFADGKKLWYAGRKKSNWKREDEMSACESEYRYGYFKKLCPDCGIKFRVFHGSRVKCHRCRYKIFKKNNGADGRKGSNNHNWKGGVSQYPNHSLFKRTRIKRLRDVAHTCESCGDVAKHVHHKDGSKDKHDYNNLEALCILCHRRRHKEMRQLLPA